MSPKRRNKRKQDFEPTFFVDECFGRKTAQALRDAGAVVEYCLDHFERGELDEIWLPDVGRRRWFLITRDDKQRWRRNELVAMKRAKVGAFVLRGKSLTLHEINEALVRALPAMKRTATRVAPHFVYAVFRDGMLKVRLAGKRRGGRKRR